MEKSPIKGKKENSNYSLKVILLNDYISFLAGIFPLVILGITIFTQLFGFFPDLKRGRPPLGTEAIPFFIQFGLIAIVIGAIIIALRVVKIKKILEQDIEVDGKVTKVWKYRDSWRIYFTYRYKNMEFDNSILTVYNKKTKVLMPNKKIRVIINPEDPLKATIKEVFR